MTVDEILEYILASVPDEYDASAGSFFYDLLYPVAEQSVERKPATYSQGMLKITGNRGEVVSEGSKVAADTVLFAVDETVSIPESGEVEVSASCTMPGTRGNVKAGSINRFPVTLPGLTAVENITDFTGGYDEESDADLLERYLEKVSRPNISGNKYHYISWAKEVVGVGDVRVIPLWNGEGTVKVVIINSDNQPADADLIEKVKNHIEEKRPIGAKVTVVSATALQINVSVKLETDDTPTIQENIKKVISIYLSGDAIKKSYISIAKVGSLILSVPGVEDYSNLKINNGTANIPIEDGAVPVLGSVVIT